MLRRLILLCGLVICTNIVAVDTYNLTGQQTVKAAIALDALNRIVVKNDRILKVFGMAGDFIIETEETSGQIFIRPVTKLGKKAKDLSISLVTEAGRTIDLVLQPTASSAATIVLNPQGSNAKLAGAWETRRPFEATLKKLINAMYAGKNVPGYKRTCVEREWQVWQDVRLKEVAIYKGKKLRGVELAVSNNTSRHKILHEAQFLLNPGIAAIAIAERNLEPKGTTRVFVIYHD